MTLDPETGYVVDTEYTFNVYPEMFPSNLSYVCAERGYATRLSRLNEGFDYCELGCGNGVGSNLMAASHPQGRFVAVDLNPAHIVNGRRLAEAANLGNIRFLESVFADLLTRDDLPEFDIIALHGVYSWIGERHRAEVVSFIRDRLRPGGVVYVSYNTLPGWADSMPIRQLMVEHTAGMNVSSVERAGIARDFLKEISGYKMGYFGEGTLPANIVKSLDQQSREYLAHEYLNADWHPQYSAEVAREMARARLAYVGDATLRNNALSLLFPEPVQKFITSAPSPTAVQTRKDYLTSIRFRQDLFVKGANRVMAMGREGLYASIRFASMKTDPIPTAIATPSREISLEGLPREMVARCRERPLQALDIIERFLAAGHSAATALYYLEVLVAMALLEPIPIDRESYGEFPGLDVAKQRLFSIGDFNRAICAFSFSRMINATLVAPLTGARQVVSWLEAGLLLGWEQEGADGAAGWCAARILRTGNNLVSDGRALVGQGEHVDFLNGTLGNFCDNRLPTLVKAGAITVTEGRGQGAEGRG
ncbi:MAG: class I SAM-dependent methyltransferase [Alphaproteobacteria bacterium]